MTPYEQAARRGIERLSRANLDGEIAFPRPDLSFLPRAQMARIVRLARFWEREGFSTLEEATKNLIVGLHGQDVGWTSLLRGSRTAIEYWFGLVAASGPGNPSSLKTLLAGSFADVMPLDVAAPSAQYGLAVRVSGVPTARVDAKQAATGDRVERLCRGLYGDDWAFVVQAEPVSRAEIVAMIEELDDEMTSVGQVPRELAMLGRSGVVERYVDLLQSQRKRLEQGRASGMWKTRVWLLANSPAVLYRGRGLLHAAFSGGPPTVQPIRSHSCSAEAREERRRDVLTSDEAALLVCPPREEYPGYELVDYARFGVASGLPQSGGGAASRPPGEDRPFVLVGDVLDRGNPTGNALQLPLDDLTKHGLIVGVTGSGKTNTCFELLAQLAQRNVPFMVIESAKSEYRFLREDRRFVPPPRVYTVGVERAAPLRLNPFEVPPGILVQTHVDYLKALFSAAFVLYPPMPYVLEQSIQEVYQDRGWDLATSQNWRQDLDGYAGPRLFPTLTDLVAKVDDVVDRMGYDERLKMDVKAGLVARLDQLRGGGGKGPMLNTRELLDLEIFERPCILELKEIVNDDEKAFLIGLLLVRLYEHHEGRAARSTRRDARAGGLRHLTLIEEAHRLLRNVSTEQGSEVTANPKGRAIEVFANILSEIRAYGEGILIAEQVPVKLTPDAIKNTNLKVVHRLLAEDDRVAVGSTMNLTREQTQYLTTLPPGVAIAYTEGLQKPVLLRVALSPAKDGHPVRVTADLGEGDQAAGDATSRLVGPSSQPLIDAARRLFNALRLEPLDHALILDTFAEFDRTCRRAAPPSTPAVVSRTFAGLVDAEIERRGELAAWPYSRVDELARRASQVIEGLAGVRPTDWDDLPPDLQGEIAELARFATEQHAIAESDLPFVGCRACSAPCQFRFDMLGERHPARGVAFRDLYLGQSDAAELAEPCLDAAEDALPFASEEVQRQAALCFAVQQLGELGIPASWQRNYVEQIASVLSPVESDGE